MMSVARGIAAVMLAAGVTHAAPPAHAQTLSDESVKTLIGYAWAQTPKRFTIPDGRVIEIDKDNGREKTVVPIDVARDVVIAGRRSALAQICNLIEEQVNNYRSLMGRELTKKKWSEQQVVFINVLHLTTVQIFAGDVKIKMEADGGKIIEENSPTNKSNQSCSDAERAKLKEQIETYIAQGPKLLEPPEQKAADKGPPATTGAAKQPVPAAQTQKK